MKLPTRDKCRPSGRQQVVAHPFFVCDALPKSGLRWTKHRSRNVKVSLRHIKLADLNMHLMHASHVLNRYAVSSVEAFMYVVLKTWQQPAVTEASSALLPPVSRMVHSILRSLQQTLFFSLAFVCCHSIRTSRNGRETCSPRHRESVPNQPNRG